MPVWDVPERNLKVMGSIEWSEGVYSTLVIQDVNKRLYVVSDYGCSGEYLFEDFLKVSDMGDSMTIPETIGLLKMLADVSHESPEELTRYHYQISGIMEEIYRDSV